jgi:serine/threonine protein kinase
MVMRLLDGFTLRQIVRELGRLPVPWALRIMRDVCAGLHAIHEFAIHRDIKPENIQLDRDGHVWVLDLGAGKFVSQG